METSEKLITKNLDVWTSAIKKKSSAGRGSSKQRELYGINKLRELILELAVRGLLTPSDTKWSAAQFGEIFDIQGGTQPPKSQFIFEPQEGYVRLLQIRDLGEKPVPTFIPEESARRFCDENDILIGRYGASVGKIFRGQKGAYNVALARLIWDPATFAQNFLITWLKSGAFQNCLAGASRSAQAGFNKGDLASIRIQYPPLAEQHRIVAKVAELMALCDQLEQEQESNIAAHDTLVATLLNALTETTAFAEAWKRIQANFDTLFTTESSIDQLKQAILQLAVMGKLVEQDPEDEPAAELLKSIAAKKAQLIKEKKIKKQKVLPIVTKETQPFTVPPSWAWASFWEIIESLKYGTSKKCYEHEEGKPVLRIPNLKNGHLSDYNLKYTDLTADEIEQLGLETRDLLIIRSNGSLSLVGRSAPVSEKFEGYAYAGYLVRARTLKSKFQLGFLHLLFESPLVREQIEVPIRHGVGLKNINSTEISRLKLSIPPLSEQHRIVAKVDELMALCDALKASLATAQATQLNLADSLVEQAVT